MVWSRVERYLSKNEKTSGATKSGIVLDKITKKAHISYIYDNVNDRDVGATYTVSN